MADPHATARELVRRYIVGDPATRSKTPRRDVLAALDALASDLAAAHTREERLERGLADAYREAKPGSGLLSLIAHLCDDHLDRSGALLGRVRALASAGDPAKETTPHGR